MMLQQPRSLELRFLLELLGWFAGFFAKAAKAKATN